MADGTLRNLDNGTIADWAAWRAVLVAVIGGRRYAAPTPDIAAAMIRAARAKPVNWCAYHHDGRPEWPAFWFKIHDRAAIRILAAGTGFAVATWHGDQWSNPALLNGNTNAYLTRRSRGVLAEQTAVLELNGSHTLHIVGYQTRHLEQILDPLNHWLTSQRTIEPETPVTDTPTVTFTTINGGWSTAVITIADHVAPIGIAEQPTTWLQHTIDDNVELNVQAGKHLEKYRLPTRIAELIHDAIIQLVAGTFTTGLWNLLAQRIAAAGWEAIHRYSGHITFDPTQDTPPLLPKEAWDVWDGMNTDIRTDALYVVSGQRLANILGDRRVLNNLRNGGTETIDGKTYRLVDTKSLISAFGRFVEPHTLDEPDDDDVHDGDAWG